MSRLLALLLLFAACSGGKAGDDDEQQAPGPGSPPAPPPSGTVTAQPTAPSGSAPPVGVTWHVGFTENVTLARMQGFFASLVGANNAIWNLSEGQVRIDRIRFYDAVAPGLRASQLFFGGGGASTTNLDILVFSPGTWDVPASGAVGEMPGQGRTGRLMVVPENANTFVLVHEGSHFLFRLTWSAGSLLVDEYQDGVQDAACVMESENLPTRWCSDANHASQSSQPRACWAQILTDYPSFRHAGRDTATGLPATPVAEYNDTP